MTTRGKKEKNSKTLSVHRLTPIRVFPPKTRMHTKIPLSMAAQPSSLIKSPKSYPTIGRKPPKSLLPY